MRAPTCIPVLFGGASRRHALLGGCRGGAVAPYLIDSHWIADRPPQRTALQCNGSMDATRRCQRQSDAAAGPACPVTVGRSLAFQAWPAVHLVHWEASQASQAPNAEDQAVHLPDPAPSGSSSNSKQLGY